MITEKRNNMLENAYKKSYIQYKGREMIHNDFILKNLSVISDLLYSPVRRRGLILHPGTDVLFFLSTILGSFTSFLLNQDTQDSLLDILVVGDMVIYNNRRGIYKGLDDEDRIIIESDCLYRVPKSMIHKILPYNGNANTLSGKGVRYNPNLKNDILSRIFDIEPNMINNLTNQSIVILSEKRRIYEIMSALTIGIDKLTSLKISEIFPAAYYTDSEKHNFVGNSANVEPVLKFTGSLSVAKKLIVNDKNNLIFGLIVNGEKFMGVESTELITLMKRRSLQKVVLLSEIQSNIFTNLKNQCDDLESYIWDEEAIKKYIKDIDIAVNNKTVVDQFSYIYKVMANTIKREIGMELIETPLKENSFQECKKALYELQNSEDMSPSINQFILYSYYLLKLFETSCFPISSMEILIQKEEANFLSPIKVLNMLEELSFEKKGDIFENMRTAIWHLKDINNTLYHDNQKHKYLQKLAEMVLLEGKKTNITIVTPKTYYNKIFRESIRENERNLYATFDFITFSEFNRNKYYDHVIFLSPLYWQKLNPFSLYNADSITILCYPFEEGLYKAVGKFYKKERLDFQKSNLLTGNFNLQREIKDDNDESKDSIETWFSKELEVRISKSIANHSAPGESDERWEKNTSEIVRIAVMETGEFVYMTKYYRPYVVDDKKGSVTEKNIFEIKEGNVLLFTENNSETKDIVEKILKNYIKKGEENNPLKKEYIKSKYWKKVLKKYIKLNNLTYKDLSKMMIRLKGGKHEQTIRAWLDEDSHIVGPRDVKTFYVIAKITKDRAMMKNPKSFFRACNIIRSIRMEILKQLGKSILASYATENTEKDSYFSSAVNEAFQLARTLRVETIIEADKGMVMPSYLVNKPYSIGKI